MKYQKLILTSVLYIVFHIACSKSPDVIISTLSSEKEYALFTNNLLANLPGSKEGWQHQDVVIPYVVAKAGSIQITRIYQKTAETNREIAVEISFNKNTIDNWKPTILKRSDIEYRRQMESSAMGSYDEFRLNGKIVVFEWPNPVF